jgi:ribosomal protein L11 methyltransferase
VDRGVDRGVSGEGTTWALRTNGTLEDANVHLAALEAAGLLGISEEDGRATLWFPARAEGLPLGGDWEPVEDRDWNARSRALLTPVTVGTVTVAPPWAAGQGDLVIDPAQAFGTGHHETTTGCLAALQELALDGRSVLDVGCGSGVLAIAAARLGAGSVTALDIDPLAVKAARANAAANAATVEAVEGSVDAAGDRRFDVVLANLDTTTLARLADRLVARLAPGGTLIASGVGLERQAEAVGAFAAAGLAVLVRAGGEWAVVVGHVRPAPGTAG